LHADYVCGRSGVCCATQWNVPVETEAFEQIRSAIKEGRLPADAAGGRTLEAAFPERQSERGDRLRVIDMEPGGCSFHSGQSCRIHDTLGADVLPDVCRLFPRVVVEQPRGIFVSLSHFCPTAVGHLFRDFEPGELAPVDRPAAFPAEARLKGLDARTHVPPLVAPQHPMSWTVFERWERFASEWLADPSASVEVQLAGLAQVVEAVRSAVMLGRRPEDVVRREVQAARRAGPEAMRTRGPAVDRSYEQTHFMVGHLVSLVPSHASFLLPAQRQFGRELADRETYARAMEAVDWERFELAFRRYVAARHFGNWYAYQGQGLRSSLTSLVMGLHLARTFAWLVARRDGTPVAEVAMREGFRAADYFLLHAMPRSALARSFGALEQASPENVFRLALGG
jgi:Fe-S-cluster containining protein